MSLVSFSTMWDFIQLCLSSKRDKFIPFPINSLCMVTVHKCVNTFNQADLYEFSLQIKDLNLKYLKLCCYRLNGFGGLVSIKFICLS